jgi:hypothetical protein
MENLPAVLSPARPPRHVPHPALSDVRATLRAMVAEAEELRSVRDGMLVIGRDCLHRAKFAETASETKSSVIAYEHFDKSAKTLAQTAATRRALHLLYAMLRGRRYLDVEGKCAKSKYPFADRILQRAREAIAKRTGRSFSNHDFNLPSDNRIAAWVRGEPLFSQTPVDPKLAAST